MKDRSGDAGYLLWAAVSGVLIAFAAVMLFGCASCGAGAQTADQRVRSALDAFGLAAAPTWSALNAACAYQQRAIEAEAKADTITTDEARAQLGPVRARCARATDTIRAIRRAHDQAADLVEAGRIAEAEAWLGTLRERWSDFRDLEAEDAGAP